MTKPPCYNDGTDCPRRYVGCKAECAEWHKWLVIHEGEKEKIRTAKEKDKAVDGFLIEQTKRVQQARHRDYMREHRK